MVVLDESRCQNTTNTARRLCESIVNGIHKPNQLKKTGERFGVNGIGFQGINCQSAIFFNQKNNSNNFVITLIQYLIQTIDNQKAIKILYDIVCSPKIDTTNIKLELLKSRSTPEEFNKIFDKNNNIQENKFKYYCRKYRINYYKVNKTQKERLETMLNNKELINIMKEEKPLNIILDNAKIHTSKIVEVACEMLSVKLVFLPPYSPFLSPIEDVWKDIKREVYNTHYSSLYELTDLFKTKFYEKVDNISYYENWVMKFFGVNIQ